MTSSMFMFRYMSIPLAFFVFPIWCASATTLSVKIDHNYCEFGDTLVEYIRLSNVRSSLPSEMSLIGKLKSVSDYLNNNYGSVCANGIYKRLDDDLKALVKQRVAVFNRCTADVAALHGSDDIGSLIGITIRKGDMVKDISSLYAYWADMHAAAGEKSAEAAEKIDKFIEFMSPISSGYKLTRDTVAGILLNKSFRMELLKYTLEKTTDKMKDITYESASGGDGIKFAYNYYSYLALKYYYNKNNKKYLPKNIDTNRCGE